MQEQNTTTEAGVICVSKSLARLHFNLKKSPLKPIPQNTCKLYLQLIKKKWWFNAGNAENEGAAKKIMAKIQKKRRFCVFRKKSVQNFAKGTERQRELKVWPAWGKEKLETFIKGATITDQQM